MATLDELLQATSRTFALAIPLLPEPERTDVTLGYLVFRIADTLEDAENLGRDERIAGLEAFISLLEEPDGAAAERFATTWSATRPSTNPDYNRLVAHTELVTTAIGNRRPAARDAILRHALRSAAGMRQTLLGADPEGRLACRSVGELREYCYYVAGIVGEMLTELFALRIENEAALAKLRDHGRWFGEGLQLVNILKDADADARDGRHYLPEGTTPADVLSIAREDLHRAEHYTAALIDAGAEDGVVAFARLPRELAVATLAKLEAEGPGAKITRPEVGAILNSVAGSLRGPRGATKNLATGAPGIT